MNHRCVSGIAAFGVAAAIVALAACGSGDGGDAGTPGPSVATPVATSGPRPASSDVLAVPGDFDTIQAAVDAAHPGDLVLISPGIYNEAVNVVTEEVTIRGLDRNLVVLDGEFELENGVRVLGAGGVAVENLTVRNYTSNGVFWTSVDGYRGSYLTVTRNGGYGIYAFDSVNGLLEHSYASGSSDAGFYIGQCYECNAVVDDVVSEYNRLGYSGTTSGGHLYIVNSRFNNNRVGIDVNSATYELCYPQRRTTIVGNTVHSNNQADTPTIGNSSTAMGFGILVEGGVGNVIERNLVFDHLAVGIALVTFPELEPNDAEPSEDTWDVPCAEARRQPLADPDTLEPIFWRPLDNRAVGNVVEDSGVADLALSAVTAELSPIDPTTLGNCFGDNRFTTSAPTDIEGIVPCGGEGNGADWLLGDLDVSSWLSDTHAAPPSVDFAEAPTPAPPRLAGMADPATAPAEPAIDTPPPVDIDSIVVPSRP